MRSRRPFCAALGALAAAAIAGSSLADEVVTFTGVVSGGAGGTTPFGAGAAALTGDSFTLTFQVFDSNPLYTPFTQSFGATGSSVSGGFFNGTSPVVADLTINGASFDDHGLWTNGSASLTDAASGLSSVSYTAQDENYGPGSASLSAMISSATDPFVTDPDYRDALTHTVVGADQASGAFTENFGDAGGFTIDLAPQTISIASAAPEPAAWTMMILGVGLCGGALRARRKAISVSA